VVLMNSVNVLLIGNSLLTVLFILNQNDSNKELSKTNNSSSAVNPLERFTWVCLFIQLILFLLKTKTTDF
jgi:hypothetical protein